MHLQTRTRRALAAVAALVLTLGGAACSDPNDGISGNYVASEATITTGGEEFDLIDEGLAIGMTLTQAGTTSGLITIPATRSESGELETYSLAGTYQYDAEAGTATFEHEADTFIRDVTWEVDGSDLRATFATDEGELAVTLERRN
jgi:hypothetical protein